MVIKPLGKRWFYCLAPVQHAAATPLYKSNSSLAGRVKYLAPSERSGVG